MNKGRIHKELRYFWGVLKNLIKWDNELKWEIRKCDRFMKRTSRKIHGIKNHSIWIKIRGEIKKQKLGRISEREER